MNKPFCRRCLLQDLPDEAQLAHSIQELIDLLPQEKRAAEEQRSTRLSLCKQCDSLINGMCVLCGCYVELRAAKAHMGCPHVPPHW